MKSVIGIVVLAGTVNVYATRETSIQQKTYEISQSAALKNINRALEYQDNMLKRIHALEGKKIGDSETFELLGRFIAIEEVLDILNHELVTLERYSRTKKNSTLHYYCTTLLVPYNKLQINLTQIKKALGRLTPPLNN
jgi:hypothetical protein